MSVCVCLCVSVCVRMVSCCVQGLRIHALRSRNEGVGSLFAVVAVNWTDSSGRITQIPEMQRTKYRQIVWLRMQSLAVLEVSGDFRSRFIIKLTVIGKNTVLITAVLPTHLGSCQNYGPFLGTRVPSIIGAVLH